MTLLRIGTVARLAGVPVETVRTWERRYGRTPAARTAGNQRLYSIEDVERLRAIKAAMSSGLSAREAYTLLRERPDVDGYQAYSVLVDAAGRQPAARERESSGARRIRALVDATWDGVYLMSSDWSEMRALTAVGFMASTEKPSTSWLDKYIHPEDQPTVVAAIDAAIASKSLFELEHRVLRADGKLGWTLSRAVPLFDRGTIVEWVGAAMDVTARHETEEALSRSEGRLRRVLETDAVGVVFFDRSGTVVDANDVFLRLTGYGRTDIEHRRLTWRTMTPPEWVETTEQQMRRLIATGRHGPYEKECLCSSGSRRWFLVIGRDLGDGTFCEYCVDLNGMTLRDHA